MAKAVMVTAATGRKLAQRANTDVPTPPRHEIVDLALRQHVQRIETGFLEFLELAREAIDGAYYIKFGFQDPERYFQDRLGASYRSVRRRLSILDGLDRLVVGERERAKVALASLGGHKAAEVARLLGRRDGWAELAARAQDMTEEAVRDEVSARLGSKPRGLPSEPGEKFLRALLNRLPIDVIEWTESVFTVGMKAADTHNPVVVFILMVECFAADLSAQGIEVPPR